MLNPVLHSTSRHRSVIISSYPRLPWEKPSPPWCSKSWLLPLIPAPFPYFKNVAGPLPSAGLWFFTLQLYKEQAGFGVLEAPSSRMMGFQKPKAQSGAAVTQRASQRHKYSTTNLLFCSNCKSVLSKISLSIIKKSYLTNGSFGACGRCWWGSIPKLQAISLFTCSHSG